MLDYHATLYTTILSVTYLSSFGVVPTSTFLLGEQQRVRDSRGAAVTCPVAPAAAVVPVGEAVVVPDVQSCQIVPMFMGISPNFKLF